MNFIETLFMSTILLGVALMVMYIFASVIYDIYHLLQMRIEEKRNEKQSQREEIQRLCLENWNRIFEEKRAEKGELWACEHLESFGLIEENR